VTVGVALALPLVASLAALAGVDAEVGLRAEGRTSTLAPAGLATETRGAILAVPRASLRIAVAPLRIDARYEARIWTSDVERHPSPLATHSAELRLGTRRDLPWRAEVSASAARGRTDPLADPILALASTGLLQATALDPVPFEALRTTASGSIAFGPRTTLAGGATAWHSGASDRADRLTLPVQRGATAELSLARLASLRDTLRLRARGSATTTAGVAADVDAASGWASAGWRRRMTPMLDGWLDAGAALWWEDRPAEPARRGVLPVGEAGAAYERGPATLELAAQAEPYTDRLTGVLDPMMRARAALRWRVSPRTSLASTASAGALPDGDTALASFDARVRYGWRETLAVEVGLVGRWQRERRTAVPTFAEGGVVVALAWESGPL
jgi:hypothetical protein